MTLYEDGLETLRKIPVKNVQRLTRSRTADGTAVQPPIFFPLD
ncbi:MAG: hypothetical protein ACOY3N_31375 [Bradyrhizobium sp.]